MARQGKKWMPDERLIALVNGGCTGKEIAAANERLTGWPPSPAAVSVKIKSLNLPPRYGSRKDLCPWDNIKPQDKHHRYRGFLESESRRREAERTPGKELTRTDKRNCDLLNNLLFGRGKELVIGYDPAVGWYLADRVKQDVDIIRFPAAT